MKPLALLFGCLLLLAMAMQVPGRAQQPVVPKTHLKVGDVAPDFTLPDQNRKPVNLSDFRGKKNVILAFYVMAFGPNCTNEVKTYQADIANGKIDLNETAVLGVGMDNPYANAEFAKQLGVQFPVLSDITRKVTKAYGILNDEKQLANRTTFVVDKRGVIQYIAEGPDALDPTGAVTILLLSWAVGAQAPATAPIALKDEPHHHLLFANEYVRAWATEIAGHQATLLHNHDLPYFALAVGSADFINAVTGKPEAHVTLTDGQVSYSKGGFSHLVRTETDTPFRNLTIELLRPQGAARNRCVKVIADSALDCPQTTVSPLGATTTLVFETDEIAMQSGEISSILRIAGADTRPARLLAVLDQSELSVETRGQPAKKLHSGEALWLNAGGAATFVNSGAGATSRFVLVTFKDTGAK